MSFLANEKLFTVSASCNPLRLRSVFDEEQRCECSLAMVQCAQDPHSADISTCHARYQLHTASVSYTFWNGDKHHRSDELKKKH